MNKPNRRSLLKALAAAITAPAAVAAIPAARRDVITQAELRHALELEYAKESYIHSIGRRLAAGATLEPGPVEAELGAGFDPSRPRLGYGVANVAGGVNIG